MVCVEIYAVTVYVSLIRGLHQQLSGPLMLLAKLSEACDGRPVNKVFHADLNCFFSRR